MQQNTKRILIFLAFAFGVPWAAALGVYLSGMAASNPNQAVSLTNTIFIATPWLANIATRLITREGWGNLWLRPNFRRGWRFYLAAWLLPLVAVAAGATAFYLLVPQAFDPGLSQVQKQFASVPAMAGVNPWLIMVSIVAQSALIAVPINTIASMGEEFGWRAYLLQKLMGGFGGGARMAAILVGLVWGVWHWPLFFLSMKADPSMPLLYPVVYLLTTCALSMLLTWVTLRSGSVWPAAIGHGAINAFSGLVAFTLANPTNMLLGPMTGGLIGSLGFFVLALVLFFSRNAFGGEGATHLERVDQAPTVV